MTETLDTILTANTETNVNVGWKDIRESLPSTKEIWEAVPHWMKVVGAAGVITLLAGAQVDASQGLDRISVVFQNDPNGTITTAMGVGAFYGIGQAIKSEMSKSATKDYKGAGVSAFVGEAVKLGFEEATEWGAAAVMILVFIANVPPDSIAFMGKFNGVLSGVRALLPVLRKK